MQKEKPPINSNVHDRREIRFFLNQLIPPNNFNPSANTPEHALYVTVIFDRGSIYTTSYYYLPHFHDYGYNVTTYSPSIYDSVPHVPIRHYLYARYSRQEPKITLKSPWTNKVIHNISQVSDLDKLIKQTLTPGEDIYLLSFERYLVSRNNYITLSLITCYPVLLYTLSEEWSRYTRIFTPVAYLVIERYRHNDYFQCAVYIEYEKLTKANQQ